MECSPHLKESDTTPDPRSRCFGFVQAMIYHRKAWEPLLLMEEGFLTVAPILMTAEPDVDLEGRDWEVRAGVLTPGKQAGTSCLQ
jgi:hypothetical protein